MKDGEVFYVTDVETTGFSTKDADAIEVSAIKVQRKGREFVVLDEFDTYINPQYPLPDKIVEFNLLHNTGINDEFLKDKPLASEIANKLYDFFGCCPILVGHNLPFDLKFLNKIYQNCLGRELITKREIDTLEISRRVETGKHDLASMFEKTDKTFSNAVPKFHTSLADCYATLDVYAYLTKKEE